MKETEERRRATLKETEAIQRRIHDRLMPHSQKLAEIWLSGRFACAAIDLEESYAKVLKKNGWNIQEECSAMSDAQVRAIAGTDPAAERWCATPPDDRRGKVLVWMGAGSLLVNFDRNLRQWSFEPGSLDTEWQN